MRVRSLTTISRKRATAGSKSPFATCAKRIRETGRKPAAAKTAPIPRTTSHTERAGSLRMLRSQPSVPVTAYAAASGAVTAEESPAASRPAAKKTRAQPPSNGSSCTAMSAAVDI